MRQKERVVERGEHTRRDRKTQREAQRKREREKENAGCRELEV